jgi:hypothetical protein
MDQHDDNSREEIEGGTADVVAGRVSIRQGGVRSVRAHEVQIRQGGALRVNAEEVAVTQGGIAFATTGGATVTAGGMGVLAASGPVELTATAAQVVLARERADLGQCAAAVVAAGSVEVSDSAIGVLIGRRVEARNVRVLFGVPAAIAFGAAAGAVLWLLGRWRR